MRILIIDDEHFHAEKLAAPFSSDEVETADTLKEAVNALNDAWPDLVILDAMFPESLPSTGYPMPVFMAGRFLDEMEKLCDEKRLERPDVLLVSGQDEAAKQFKSVVDWLHDGRISDVLPKSAANIGWDFFQAVIRHKVEGLRRERELRPARRELKDAFASLKAHAIITGDRRMTEVWEQLSNAAKMGCNVFIHGETGSGKELVARAIAKLRSCNFLAVNCRGIPPTLLESELFGTMPGAGANLINRAGKIEAAGDGVLFLDEICSLPFDAQGILLRAVDENVREFSRLGENRIRKATCMFVFADNTALLEAVAKNNFRADLAYRLATVEIVLPPLRERRSDIPLLICHFVEQLKRDCRKQIQLTQEVISTFENGSWPGNVRALESFLKRIVTMNSGLVTWDKVKRTFQNSLQALVQEVGPELIPGLSSSQPAEASNMELPNDQQQLLTRLRIEIEYEKPTAWWAFGERSKDAENECKTFDILDMLLNDEGCKLRDALKRALEDRRDAHGKPRNDPRRIHHYTGLLYLAVHPQHEADISDLSRITRLNSWVKPAMIGEELTSLSPENPQSLVLVEEGERKRKVYRLREGLLRDGVEAAKVNAQ